MPHLNPKKNVYIVEGYSRHCIYDLNRNCLYSINGATLDIINEILHKNYAKRNLTNENPEIISYLLNKDLLHYSENTESSYDIKVLKKTKSIRFAWIEVIKICNQNCIFCYNSGGILKNCFITFEAFARIADQLCEIGVDSIQITGGEPLLLKDLLKMMLSLSVEKFSKVELYTNGTLINDDWVNFFSDKNIKIALSIHSDIPHEHDKITGTNGSYYRVLNSIKLLRKKKIKFRLAAVEISNLQCGEKIDGINLKRDLVRLTNNRFIDFYNYSMFIRKAIKPISKALPLNKETVINALSGHQCFMEKVYINCDFDVFPCAMERRIKHGNLHNNRLKNIINPKICDMTKDNVDICCLCEYRYACFDCRPDSNGARLKAKPWYCTYDPLKGEWNDLDTIYFQLKNGTES